MIHPSVYEEVRQLIETPFEYPEEIIAALREDEAVWKNWNAFTEPYRRIRTGYVAAAGNRSEEFQKRLHTLIRKTKANKLISGYGGIEKYYGSVRPEKNTENR